MKTTRTDSKEQERAARGSFRLKSRTAADVESIVERIRSKAERTREELNTQRVMPPLDEV